MVKRGRVGSGSPSPPKQASGWHKLPLELRELVLDFAKAPALKKRKSHALAAYACVCKEWQSIVEPANFRSIWVTGQDLDKFNEYVVGKRRTYLQHLFLKVVLPRYPKRKNRTPETEDEQDANDIELTTHVLSLFGSLAKWEVDENPNGIELEISAKSPSDAAKLVGVSGLTEDGQSRYFESQLDFSFLDFGWIGPYGLPEVQVVTKLAVLRRCWRNLDAMAMLTLASSLPRLRDLRYEPWQQFDDGAQEVLDMERARLLPFWPKTIKRMSMMEHFDLGPDGKDPALAVQPAAGDGDSDDGFVDEDEDVIMGSDEDSDTAAAATEVMITGATDADSTHTSEDEAGEVEPRTCAALAESIRRCSLGLEELSVSFMIDARHFFRDFLSRQAGSTGGRSGRPYWPSLRWLTLTSSVVHENVNPEKLDDLFIGIAKAVKRMPQLHILEVFNVCRHSGGVFRYHVANNTATIQFEGTWQYAPSLNVQRAFGEAAKTHVRTPLETLPENVFPRHPGQFQFLQDHLFTRELVVHPGSWVDMMPKSPPKTSPKLRLR